MSGRIVSRIIYIPSLLSIVFVLIFWRQAEHLKSVADEKLVVYSTSDGLITITHPSNWLPKETQQQAMDTTVVFKPSGDLFYKAEYNLKGSLQMDVMTSIPGGMGTDNPGSTSAPSTGGSIKMAALKTVHKQHAEKLLFDLPDMKVSSLQTCQIAGVEGYVSDFTYTRTVDLSLQHRLGKFYTVLVGDRLLTVLYHCDESVSKKLLPVFEKMTDSIKIRQGTKQQ